MITAYDSALKIELTISYESLFPYLELCEILNFSFWRISAKPVPSLEAGITVFYIMSLHLSSSAPLQKTKGHTFHQPTPTQ